MRVLIFLLFSPVLLKAQVQQENGIRFINKLTWQEVLKKAKAEKKYVFIDCYTTWCGPCKLMDKEVYPQEQVGAFFNEHFISVKLQMDKTEHDNQQVKNWYPNIDKFQVKYGVPVYPTYLFFSPEGQLVSRDKGYKNADDFLAVAEKLIASRGPKPYARYYQLLSEYEAGKKDYKTMPALMDTAKSLGQHDQEENIAKDYKNHLLIAKDNELYTKANISFLASHIQRSTDPLFHLFYPDGGRADSVVGVKGSSDFMVDNILQKEIISPVISVSMDHEPDWGMVGKTIGDKYPGNYGERSVLKSRIKWYQDHHEWGKCAQYLTLLGKKYSMDGNDGDTDGGLMFAIWWSIFDRSVDKEQIDVAIETMKGIMKRVAGRNDAPFCFSDTYANLLYKAGKTEDAIIEEAKTVEQAIEWKQDEGTIKDFQSTLDKMKKGMPTWPRYIDKDDIFGNGLI